jgi:hypothetical protein
MVIKCQAAEGFLCDLKESHQGSGGAWVLDWVLSCLNSSKWLLFLLLGALGFCSFGLCFSSNCLLNSRAAFFGALRSWRQWVVPWPLRYPPELGHQACFAGHLFVVLLENLECTQPLPRQLDHVIVASFVTAALAAQLAVEQMHICCHICLPMASETEQIPNCQSLIDTRRCCSAIKLTRLSAEPFYCVTCFFVDKSGEVGWVSRPAVEGRKLLCWSTIKAEGQPL